jgi:predicted nucleic acid-binding protein
VRFVDTSFWVAHQFRRDTHHQTARRLWLAEREPLLSTNLIIGETWTHLNRRLGHYAALAFYNGIARSPTLTIVRVDEIIEAQAWLWLQQHDERVYLFVDATSFATMRGMNIMHALAFDGDFSAANFIEVRP